MSKNTLIIKRIYTDKIIYKTYNIPKLFFVKWIPNIKWKIKITYITKKPNIYIITLSITIMIMNKKKKITTCLINQSGIFYITLTSPKKIKFYIHVYCADILYPYAREIISNILNKGTFPNINIPPINFHLIHKNKKK